MTLSPTEIRVDQRLGASEPEANGHARECTDMRRVEIAAATRRLIVEKGLEGLRMRDIAERVGINIATLHYHVPSKEALIELVAESARSEFQAAAAPSDGLSPPQLLHQEIARFVELVSARRELLFVLAELRERSRRDPVVARIYRPMQIRCETRMRAIFEAGQADGSLRRDIPSSDAASILYGALIGCVRPPAPEPDEYKRAVSSLERLFLTESNP